MALSFRCSQCGQTYSKGEEWAGKIITCDGCHKGMRIPAPRAGIPIAPQPAEPGPMPAHASPRSAVMEAMPPPAMARPGRGFDDDDDDDDEVRPDPKDRKKPSIVTNVIGGLAACFVVMGVVGRYVIRPMRAIQNANQPPPAAAPGAVPAASPAPVFPPVPRGPWRMPALPEPGAGVVVAPGVRLFEVRLPGNGAGPGPALPGHSGKLWLYLPDGHHDPKSLGCVLIAGAGTNLITGMELGDGDRPEHLPYVRAGFAVLAYELDGMLPDPKPTTDAGIAPFIRSFLDAEAGLINMRVALAFATTKVPAIDPERLYAAGHSSAATLALLVAENEPRIAGCVAFAPVVDVTLQYKPPLQQAIARLIPGADQFFSRYNPHVGESNINGPLFLFVAKDDQLAQQVQDLAQRLNSLGKPVTLVTVTQGGHYDPMIRTGIPRAIRWLQSLERGTAQPEAAPKRAPTARPRPKTRRSAPANPPGQRNVRRPRNSPPPDPNNPDQ